MGHSDLYGRYTVRGLDTGILQALSACQMDRYDPPTKAALSLALFERIEGRKSRFVSIVARC